MKKGTLLLALAMVMAASALATPPSAYEGSAILGPGLNSGRTAFSQTYNRTLDPDTLYTLTGLYYVEDGFNLTIPAGTVVQADTAATIVVTRGGKIFCNGTAEQPVVLTSRQPEGMREPGDWGGVILLGRAPVNKVDPLIEGGIIAGTFGGTDPHDSSGSITYTRIEFPGYRFQLNNEVNGLTMGGVGDGTVLDHIQVSYSFDDSYEWFGGTVNAKHLAIFGGSDDGWDTDFGYVGEVQYAFALRDPNYWDPTGEQNGFESDNDGSGSTDTPLTHPLFSNVTYVGPERTDDIVGNLPPGHSFQYTMVLRRNSSNSIYNSVVMGCPRGMSIRDASIANAVAGILRLRNVSQQTSGVNDLTRWPGIETWFNTPGWDNIGALTRMPSAIGLTDMSDMNNPNPVPAPGSELIGSANFDLAAMPELANFEVTSYRGAFDPELPMSEQWTAGWTNFDPKGTSYVTAVEAAPLVRADMGNYPNPFNPATTIKFSVPRSGRVSLQVFDVRGHVVSTLVDGELEAGDGHEVVFAPKNVASGTYMYRLQGEGFSETRTMQLVK
ncbi:T9SS type A sorting domain-containing protein [bacterium]|nr:T9SS type A sorting domain-containing protein [bacterium]HPF35650.1 T9SS type A sorting domain-containing protein [Candidatus Krumholzibacteria bacterium]HRX51334.1 T9SS type A sorting domain-containing protein [Candidatus Krumholzibacteria bacterium]